MGNPGFRGSLDAKHYFEGWYLKQVSHDRESVISIIPGVSLNPEDSHAFIQIIDGVTGATEYISYPLEHFFAETNRFEVTVGDSTFSEHGAVLNIVRDDFTCVGTLSFSAITPYPARFLRPDIMGWFSYIPFMECFHDLVSLNHRVTGEIVLNGETKRFDSGDGYIEKDRGISFPECWIWVQCNSFDTADTSIMLSIARIPWLGRSFAGFLGFVHLNGETISFATWNSAKIQSVKRVKETLFIEVVKREYRLELTVIQKSTGELLAPTSGAMNRRIKESVDSELEFSLYRKGQLCARNRGSHAGCEIIDSIFSYLVSDGVTVEIEGVRL